MSPTVLWLAGGDVGRPLPARVEREHVGSGDVVDVHEVAELGAVLEHLRRAAGFERTAEDRGHPAYGVSLRHSGSVHVVVTQCAGGGG